MRPTTSNPTSTNSQAIDRRTLFRIAIQGSAALSIPTFVAQPSRATTNAERPPNNPRPLETAVTRQNPHEFPDETRDQIELWEAYGDPRSSAELVKVPAPYLLKISFQAGEHRRHLWAHRKVADSLGSVLERTRSHYGAGDIDRLGLNVFGGDHIDRQMTGASRWSLHAWAIAFDFDPDNNSYRMSRKQARFAHPAYDDWWTFWREEGWFAMGPERNFDFMHVQAAVRAY